MTLATVTHTSTETIVKVWCEYDGYKLYRFDRQPAGRDTKEAIEVALAGHADDCQVVQG